MQTYCCADGHRANFHLRDAYLGWNTLKSKTNASFDVMNQCGWPMVRKFITGQAIEKTSLNKPIMGIVRGIPYKPPVPPDDSTTV